MEYFSKIIYPNNYYYSNCQKIVKVKLGYVSCINRFGFQETVFDVVKYNEVCLIGTTKCLKSYTKTSIEMRSINQSNLNNLLTIYEQQTQRMEEIAVIHSYNNFKKRISSFLLWAEKKDLLESINHRIIAEILLMQRETVSRLLSSFKKQNIINYSYKTTKNLYRINIVNRKYLLEYEAG